MISYRMSALVRCHTGSKCDDVTEGCVWHRVCRFGLLRCLAKQGDVGAEHALLGLDTIRDPVHKIAKKWGSGFVHVVVPSTACLRYSLAS